MTQWEGSVTRRSSVAMSTGGEAALGGKREETTSVGLTRILLSQKIKKINTDDSVATNDR
jgi:hypothetical protein